MYFGVLILKGAGPSGRRGLDCGPGAARLLGLWVRIPRGASVVQCRELQLEISASD